MIDNDFNFVYSDVRVVYTNLESKNSLKVQNPVSNMLNFSLVQSYETFAVIRIVDLVGKEVLSSSRVFNSGNNQQSLSTETLSPGVYHLQIFNGNETVIERFIKY